MKEKVVKIVLVTFGIATFLISVSMLIGFFGLPLISWMDDVRTPSPDDIFEFVENNPDVLSDIMEELVLLKEELETDGLQLVSIGHTDINTWVENVSGLYVYVREPDQAGVYKNIDNPLLENALNKKPIHNIECHQESLVFSCGGKGFGPETSYYGFYYSPDDLPKNYCGSGDFGQLNELKPEGNGFVISYTNDDNSYYTEKIVDNFYYYEEHY